MTLRRSTRQRQALLEALRHHPGFISAQALHNQLAAQDHAISLATVYRNLQQLAEDGRLDVLYDAGEATYRACRRESHHHHLVCRQCGGADEFEAEAVADWAEQIARTAGYSQVQHTLEISGLCPQCSAT
ncbi:MAG: transcriptional repressor [Micrococcales bacterium]|nr:transcriptional repressor [Micrococcales bacterium]